jgi:phosphonopyruvate decarboxylase
MIEAAEFLEPARTRGFEFWAGVPCSYLKPFINYVIDDPALTWVSSANEGDAVATATGAALAGRRAVAIMQNSGLGNAVSPLTSLNWVFRVPVLLIVTLRGDPEPEAGQTDEPQHELMGRITGGLLERMDVPWRWFPRQPAAVEATLDEAVSYMDASGRPFALVMRKGSVAPHELRRSSPAVREVWSGAGTVGPTPARRPSRSEALAAVLERTPVETSVVIATTGYTGRELYALADRPNHLYLVGSMGCASSLGLGLSLGRPDLGVLVLDGDGAALMRLGNFATVGAYGGARFAHLLLDNGRHESTGGQATVSHGVDFAALAAACGYAPSVRLASTGFLGAWIDEGLAGRGGPRFAHLRTRPGVPESLPRPAIKPPEVRTRLMRQLGVETRWMAH